MCVSERVWDTGTRGENGWWMILDGSDLNRWVQDGKMTSSGDTIMRSLNPPNRSVFTEALQQPKQSVIAQNIWLYIQVTPELTTHVNAQKGRFPPRGTLCTPRGQTVFCHDPSKHIPPQQTQAGQTSRWRYSAHRQRQRIPSRTHKVAENPAKYLFKSSFAV